MPFKIGDKVKIIRINRDKIDSWSKDHLNKVFIITSQDTMWDDEESWYGPFFTDGKANPWRWKESELELIEESKPRFEVGKKYEGQYTKEVKTCLWADDIGALLEYKVTRSYVNHGARSYFKEYIPPPPPPVHREGWIRIYGKSVKLGIADVGCLIYPSKEDAEKLSFNTKSKRSFIVTKVEWDEPAVVYGKNTETEDDSDDDTV